MSNETLTINKVQLAAIRAKGQEFDYKAVIKPKKAEMLIVPNGTHEPDVYEKDNPIYTKDKALIKRCLGVGSLSVSLNGKLDDDPPPAPSGGAKQASKAA